MSIKNYATGWSKNPDDVCDKTKSRNNFLFQLFIELWAKPKHNLWSNPNTKHIGWYKNSWLGIVLMHLNCSFSRILATKGLFLLFFFYRNQNILMFCTRGRALDKELILIESVLIDQMFVLVFSIQKQIMISSIAIDSLSLACLIHSSSKEWQALKYLVLFFDYWLHRAYKTHC